MFKLIPIETRLCQLGSSYQFIADACRDKEEDCTFLDYRLPWSKLWCGYTNTFIYLWFVLILGVLGMLAYFLKNINPPSRWENLRFCPIPPPLARRMDMVKHFIQANTWALLLYAAIYKSPPHMYPWLVIQLSVLILKVLAAIKNYILGFLDGQRFWITLNLILHALNTWIIHKAMGAIFAAQEEDKLEFGDTIH